MTCGDAECQRARHADRCRVWHAANEDVTSTHYHDVVVPFRVRQPSYQGRWRLACGLREIREETRPVGPAFLATVRGLFSRAAQLSRAAPSEAQSGVFSGVLLDQAVAALRLMLGALEALETSMTKLGALAL